jgi:cbb3-type cytochrome oxidase subunit 3
MTLHNLFLTFLQVAGEYSPEAYARNFRSLFWGLLAAWLVLCAYLVWLVARENRLRRQLESLRRMVEDKEEQTKS